MCSSNRMGRELVRKIMLPLIILCVFYDDLFVSR